MSTHANDLDCSFRRYGDAMVLALSGPVDYATVRRVGAAVERAFTDPASGTVILDLSEVDFLGSAGIGILVEVAEAQRRDGVPTLRIVVDGTRPVIRPIQLTGLDTVLALYRSPEDALRDVERWRGSASASSGTST
ncbi:STAS domain-containing protein [Pseudonocardia sp. RS11V-5]|uniref:STAS domain-containing protein n=1 Tax=Pseudonocardia terrae TaxID=2905831 RepID=UPI001E3F885E|nr:STAS domain-containing protein [Pseudonocardia terrae]MCE3551369.1 STAS domain-containing protein [Pseudonocardia terrae]